MPKRKAIDIGEKEASIDITQKWLTGKQLRDLGIEHKIGRFSTTEKDALKKAVETYLSKHGLTAQDLQLLLYKRRNGIVEKNADVRGGHKEFLPDIARVLPNRPIEATYRCLQRMYEEANHKGPWTQEEDEKLKDLHKKYHGSWAEASQRLGRTLTNCHHRWEIIKRRETKALGRFTAEELERFKEVCTELLDAGKVPEATNSEFWEKVARKVKTRDAAQCREKWTRTMQRLYILGLDPYLAPSELLRSDKWTPADTLTLLNRIKALKINTDDEIVWSKVSTPDWPWSHRRLSQKWLWLKKRAHIELGPDTSLRKVLKFCKKRLKAGKSGAPEASPKKLKIFLSAEFVDPSDDDSDVESRSTDDMEPLESPEPVESSGSGTAHEEPKKSKSKKIEPAESEFSESSESSEAEEQPKKRKSEKKGLEVVDKMETSESEEESEEEPKNKLKSEKKVPEKKEVEKKDGVSQNTQGVVKKNKKGKIPQPKKQKQIAADKRGADRIAKPIAKKEAEAAKKGTPQPRNKAKDLSKAAPDTTKAAAKENRRLAPLERQKVKKAKRDRIAAQKAFKQTEKRQEEAVSTS
jgi:hypothetical protein